MIKLAPNVISRVYKVTRWHTHWPRREQPLLEHLAAVALIAVQIAPALPAEELAQLYQLALLHDVHEVEFGDTPRPAKDAFRERHGYDLDLVNQKLFWEGQGRPNPMDTASEQVRAIVELADLVEAAIFATVEVPEMASRARERAEEEILRVGTHHGWQQIASRARQLLESATACDGRR